MSTRIEVDTKTFVRFWLVILGLGLLAMFIWQAATGLLIIGISLFLAIAISPLVKKIADIIPGEGRKLPTAVAYIVVMGVLSLVLMVVLPAVVSETTRFVSNLPGTVENVSNGLGWVDEVGDTFGIVNLQEQLMRGLETFSGRFVEDFGVNILNSVGAIGMFFAAFVLILVLTFLMLMEGPEMMRAFWRRFEQNKRVAKMEKVLGKMTEVVEKYVSGALTVALIDGLATTLVVFVLAVMFGFSPGLALPFGLITGVMSLIPMFGAFIGGVLVALLLAVSNVWAGLVFIIYFVIYLQIEANVISPRIQSRGMRLPALLVLGAVTLGVFTFGLIGAIVAIPIVGCVRVLVDEYAGR